ncbi:MAG TPA: alpha/beta hydrolase [Alphaproteobacteria bacterium]|nr:alpha/beta hydrolase [Alphaproteobacteria bacterium]
MNLTAIRVYLVLLLLLSACATPGLRPRGPSIQAPSMTESAFVMADGAKLPYRVWKPDPAQIGDAMPKAVIIGVHGMNDYSNAFTMPGEWFAKHDIITIAYDQRGFGEAPHRGSWAGSKSMIKDLDEVTGVVRARYPETPIYLFGVSMGGAVILASAGANELPKVDGVILAAPAVWGWQAMNIAYKLVLWTGAHIMPGKTLTGERFQIWPSDNIEMLRAMSRDPEVIKATKIATLYGLVGLMDRGYDGASSLNVPTLLLYGKKDQIVPKAPVMTVAERIPGPLRMLYYTNGYHMLERDLEAPTTVWPDIDAWIINHTAPLPSTAAHSPPIAEEVRLRPDKARTSEAN